MVFDIFFFIKLILILDEMQNLINFERRELLKEKNTSNSSKSL